MTDRSPADVDTSSGGAPERQERRVWIGPIAFATVLFVASIVPVPDLPTAGDASLAAPSVVGGTAAFHLLGYALLSALVVRAIVETDRSAGDANPRRMGVAIAVTTLFGFGIELVQFPVPWRTFAWVDVGLNAVGATLGVAGWFLVSRSVDRRSSTNR